MSEIFVTSDTHFGHANIIKYCNRPFETVEKMDDALVENWNKVVGKKDVVWHLGDFSFSDPIPYLERLNGFINWIPGNHDQKLDNIWRSFPEKINKREKIEEVRIYGHDFIMCHYPLKSWNKDFHGSIHLFGHVHNQYPFVVDAEGKSLNMSVEWWWYTPATIDQILDRYI